MKAQIRFNYADKHLNISPKLILKKAVLQVFIQEKKPAKKIDFVFCSDQFLLQINKDFLQHDYYTDIITFPLSNKEEPVEAEIYISLDRVKQNAKDLNELYQTELVRVLLHGALHLCGYKDKSKADIKLMREKEAYYINVYKKFHVKHKKLK
jgi:probable rRNA maturation factor